MEVDPSQAAKPDENDRLGSWKEIANYLGRTVRTVQRWEKTSNLPVRRLQHDAGSTVFAFKHELDRWITRRSLVVHSRKSRRRSTSPPDEPQEQATTPVERGKAIRIDRRSLYYGLTVLALLLVIVTVVMMNGAGEQPSTASISTSRLLTVDSGVERFPALSPDGRQVAYVWDGDDGQHDLYLRLVDVDEHIRLTNNNAIEESPTWAPDGLSIAYLKQSAPNTRELRVIPAIGGSDRLVTQFFVPASISVARSISASAQWSPDGQWIAITSGSEGKENLQIVLINVQSGEKIPVTSTTGTVVDLSPSFSRDGKHLAFTRSPSALRGEIHVMEINLDKPEKGRSWTLPKATSWNAEPEWSIDGKELIFSSGRWPRVSLYSVAADGTGEPRPLPGAGQGGSQPSISPLTHPGTTEGHWHLAYTVVELENDIWRFVLNEGGEQEPLLQSSQRERFPSYAQDGRIAFLSDRSGHREIWVAGTDGSKWQQWTDWKSAYVWRPSFSPDGSLLAYSVELDHVNKLHVQDGPLAPPRLLTTDDGDDADLAWARDGKTIYTFSTNRGNSGPALWAIDINGSAPRRLTRGTALPLGEDTSSQWLFMSRTSPNGASLERLALATGEIEIIPLEGEGLHSFTLGPDGVYFVSSSPTHWEIYRWDWATGEQVLARTLDEKPETGMAISPDGQHALLSRITLQRSDLMVVDGKY